MVCDLQLNKGITLKKKKQNQNPTLPCCSGLQQKQLLTEHPLPASLNFYPLFSALVKEPQLFFSLNVLLCPLWSRTPHFCPAKCGAYPFLQCVGLWEAQIPCKGTHSCPSETIYWNHRQLARFRVPSTSSLWVTHGWHSYLFLVHLPCCTVSRSCLIPVYIFCA